MIRKTLFIGNGINKLDSNLSWNEMLKGIINDMDKNNEIPFENKPYPLLYEEIYTRGKKYSKYDEKRIKNNIYNLTNKLQSNDYHRKLMDLPVKNIITTNYDYCLENANGKIDNNINKEKKYSLFRKRISGDKAIWHIHGELDIKESLMLGYEHYAGALQKMRNYVTNGISTKKKVYKSPFCEGKKDFEEEKHSWIDIFLRDEIHIVGFRFGFDEIDLWWLLSYRNRLILEKNKECGDIYYYFFDRGKDNNKEKSKLDMLEILGVKLETIKLDSQEGKYKKAWDEFINNMICT